MDKDAPSNSPLSDKPPNQHQPHPFLDRLRELEALIEADIIAWDKASAMAARTRLARLARAVRSVIRMLQ